MIRKATHQDIPDICRLLEQVLEVHNTGRPDLFRAHGKKYGEKALQEMLTWSHSPVFVYEDEGYIEGYIMCQEQSECSPALLSVKTMYIDDLCVDEYHRGEGIGKKLFEHVKSYAKKNGFYNVTLRVWNSNPGAMKFYESLGLKPQYTNLELIVNKREKIIGNYTETEIASLRKCIEETEDCKVLALKEDDSEPIWWLDIQVPDIEVFQVQDILMNFSLVSLSFTEKKITFIIESDEIQHLIDFSMEKHWKHGGN